MPDIPEKSYGLVPSPPGPHYRLASYMEAVPYPEVIDYSSKATPILYQASQPECAGFTTEKVLGYHNWGEYPTHLSPQWAYKLGKDRDGWPGGGTSFWAILQGLRQVGICWEEDWPFENRWPPRAQPGPQATAHAADLKIETYAQVSALELHSALAVFGPLMMGVMVYTSWDNIGSDGIVPPPSGQKVTGHGLPVFKSDTTDAFYPGGGVWTPNSWSTRHGKQGWDFIPYAYLRDYFIEAWSVIDIKKAKMPWPDLAGMEPDEDDRLSIDKAYQRGAFHGYEDGTFRPTGKLRKRHVGQVLLNLGRIATNPWGDGTQGENEGWDYAKRGWVREMWPDLPFRELDRDGEVLTRYQMLLLVGRLLRGVN